MESKLRIGIAGMGNAGTMHAKAVLGGSISRACIAAVCDGKSSLERARQFIPESARQFESYDEMIASGSCDAIVVATPHMQHPEQSVKALKAGLHVFCEKPSGVSASAAREMNKAAAASGKVFAMDFSRRQEPYVIKLRELISSGELGEIYRVNWIATNWYRSDSYFASAAWRGTWAGEGGGALINQCIHILDLWQHLFGLPDRVRGFCRFGKKHSVEVEDEATAFLEHGNGVTGVLSVSLCESPGTDRLEIACSRGKLVLESKSLRFYKTEVSLEEFNRANDKGFGEPPFQVCEIPVSGEADLTSGLLKNFVDAVLDGSPVLVPGSEGLASLEIENAILLSSWTDSWAGVPVDAEAFDRELKKRAAASKKTLSSTMKVFDLKDSFK